jgi:hypothetical protein
VFNEIGKPIFDVGQGSVFPEIDFLVKDIDRPVADSTREKDVRMVSAKG